MMRKNKSTQSAWTRSAPLSLLAFTEPFAVRKQQKLTVPVWQYKPELRANKEVTRKLTMGCPPPVSTAPVIGFGLASVQVRQQFLQISPASRVNHVVSFQPAAPRLPDTEAHEAQVRDAVGIGL
jgi:hypothetical protein